MRFVDTLVENEFASVAWSVSDFDHEWDFHIHWLGSGISNFSEVLCQVSSYILRALVCGWHWVSYVPSGSREWLFWISGRRPGLTLLVDLTLWSDLRSPKGACCYSVLESFHCSVYNTISFFLIAAYNSIAWLCVCDNKIYVCILSFKHSFLILPEITPFQSYIGWKSINDKLN